MVEEEICAAHLDSRIRGTGDGFGVINRVGRFGEGVIGGDVRTQTCGYIGLS